MKRAATLLAAVAVATLVPACDDPGTAMPGCGDGRRLALVAQSVSGADYLPCLGELPAGWNVSSFAAGDGATRLDLRSDRAEREVSVDFTPDCDIGAAVPTSPHEEGVRTYQLLEAISPRYAGQLYDVFAGGCVTYRFDFARGRHIALLEELAAAVRLYSRRQLRQELRQDLGVSLDP